MVAVNGGSAQPMAIAQAVEQLRYARWLDAFTRIGLLLLVLSFAAYVSGLMPAHVPVERLPELWGQPVASYLQLTASPKGWAWLGLLSRGDMISLAGIAWLAGCSLLCLLAIVPLYLQRKDRAFAVLCLAEVLVVVLAASGVLAGGH